MLFYKSKITVLGSINQKRSKAQVKVTLVEKHQKEKVTHPILNPTTLFAGRKKNPHMFF